MQESTQQNKDAITLIALICALLAVLGTVFSIFTGMDYSRRLAVLETQNQQLTQDNTFLQQQVKELSALHTPSADAFCHLIVYDWDSTASDLMLISGSVQAVFPTETAVLESAHLVLRQGIHELDRRPITLISSEDIDSFEAQIDNVRFDLPALAENDSVELLLEVRLSDREDPVISPYVSWVFRGGYLETVAG